ncbi:MAG: hypothetical protein KBD53_12280 [Candidatus Omnitrophica bacterium]|nr:hypothetical protein [Candidatus Omnitrophota bacterium]
MLTTGDHGRDLDAAEQVLRGKIVYQDYYWVYGPIMPYYYAFFYKLFGINIQSILIGKFFINLMAGIFCYFAVATLFKPWTALMAALGFWNFQGDFPHTYNHAGGILFIILIIWCLMRYIHNPKTSTLWCGLIFCLALSLIKLNFGFSSLIIFIVGVFMVDQTLKVEFLLEKKLFYLFATVVLPIITFIIYWQLLHPLAPYEIAQCFPYMPQYDLPHTNSVWQALWTFTETKIQDIRNERAYLIFCILLCWCVTLTAILWFKNKLEYQQKKILKILFVFLPLYALFNFHEYLRSGVPYRWYWAEPPLIIFIFIIFETASNSLPRFTRALFWGMIVVWIGLHSFETTANANMPRNPTQKIIGPRGGIYVSNFPDWLMTVNSTTEYLNKTLKPGETFLAIPYNILYNYLTGSPSPTRQNIFFAFIHIPPEQELKIIEEIENAKVNTIVLAREFNSKAEAFGVFGKTHCPLLWKYIQKNFSIVERFGYWDGDPGWSDSHGIIILRRKFAF